MEDMPINQLQEQLQSILHADLPLTREQRYAVKSAIEAFELVKALHPTLARIREQITEKQNTKPTGR